MAAAKMAMNHQKNVGVGGRFLDGTGRRAFLRGRNGTTLALFFEALGLGISKPH